MKKVKFSIERLDRFAQGVHFADKTTFIERALPEEKGEAIIVRSAKGVDFAQIMSIDPASTSSQRVEADCTHYDKCRGCHYRHVSYETELEFKKKSFSFELRNFLDSENPKTVEVLSLSRNYYRNRLQLHYDTKLKKIGFINKQNKQILPVHNCMLGNLLITQKLKELYKNERWLALAKSQKPKGHLEIYEKNGLVSLEWNNRYAHGGFSQVNTKVNQKLHDWIKENISPPKDARKGFVLDLFGGEGNLSEAINYDKRIVVDLYSDEQKERLSKEFNHIDLEKAQVSDYHNLALENNGQVDLMVIDPPRRGFTNIEQWVEQFKPQEILYVSCDIGSLKRDLKKVSQDYQIEKALMIDFFGGTFHYESLVYLSRTTR